MQPSDCSHPRPPRVCPNIGSHLLGNLNPSNRQIRLERLSTVQIRLLGVLSTVPPARSHTWDLCGPKPNEVDATFTRSLGLTAVHVLVLRCATETGLRATDKSLSPLFHMFARLRGLSPAEIGEEVLHGILSSRQLAIINALNPYQSHCLSKRALSHFSTISGVTSFRAVL